MNFVELAWHKKVIYKISWFGMLSLDCTYHQAQWLCTLNWWKRTAGKIHKWWKEWMYRSYLGITDITRLLWNLILTITDGWKRNLYLLLVYLINSLTLITRVSLLDFPVLIQYLLVSYWWSYCDLIKKLPSLICFNNSNPLSHKWYN